MKATPEQVLAANTSTQQHINLVRQLLRVAANELLVRGELHDQSKFSDAEIEMFARYTPRLKQMTYGSDEYNQCLQEMKEGGLAHHYANNRHHPEHFRRGIYGMNLFDVLEMFIDWLASTKRHADGDIRRSIEVNETRFAMQSQLVSIFHNTVGVFEPVKPQSVCNRARNDYALDALECAFFSSVGGTSVPEEMQAPKYIAEDDREEYLFAYRAAARETYGSLPVPEHEAHRTGGKQ